jgi:hypothetical protein
MANRLDSLQAILLNDTVLVEWFRPMQKALDKVCYSRKRFSILTAEFFILLGCLRQLQGLKIMRDQIQFLFDTDEYADKVPLARSTWSDALANLQRSEILRKGVQVLVRDARNELPDRFFGYKRVRDPPQCH